METLGNIGGLLLDGNQNVASLVVKALGGVVVSNVLDGISDDFLVVEAGLGGDLTEDHNHPGLGGSLASNLGQRVLSQAGIENSIGNLISNLVWVSFSYRLGLKKMWSEHVYLCEEGHLTVNRKLPWLWWGLMPLPLVCAAMAVMQRGV